MQPHTISDPINYTHTAWAVAFGITLLVWPQIVMFTRWIASIAYFLGSRLWATGLDLIIKRRPDLL